MLNKKVRLLLASAAICGLLPSNAYAYATYLGGEYFEDGTSYDSDVQGDTILDYLEEDTDGDFDPVDGNVVSEEDLTDSVIEYRELGTFIHRYNPTVVNAKYSVESSKDLYEYVEEDLVSWLWQARSDRDDAKDDGDMENYATYAGYEAVYKAAVKSYNSVIKSLNGDSTVRSFKSIEKALTKAAQSLMISYNTLKVSEKTLEEMAALYGALYDTQKLMYEAGMCTGNEVERAELNLESAEVSLESLKISESQIYDNLLIMLGLEGDYEIGELPDPDEDYINEVDMGKDIIKAVNNDASVISARHESSSGSAGMQLKEQSLKELEDEAEINIVSLYNDMTDAASEYEASKLSLENALQDWETIQAKESLGMLGKAEYLQEELSYISETAEYKSAKIGLFSAINSYQWALMGV